MVPLSPTNTVADAPVVVLLPVEVDKPEVALLVKPLLVTVAVSPLTAFTHTLRKVSVALLRVLVSVQAITSLLAGVRLKLVPLPDGNTVADALLLLVQLMLVL